MMNPAAGLHLVPNFMFYIQVYDIYVFAIRRGELAPIPRKIINLSFWPADKGFVRATDDFD